MAGHAPGSGYVQLWHALFEQAGIWSATLAVTDFAKELPRNAYQMNEGLPRLLQSLQAGGAHVDGQPFRLPSLVPMFMKLPGRDADFDPKKLQHWLEIGRRLEWAHRGTIAWFRSRIPGYPSIPAPQLVKNTPLTTLEFTFRLTWSPRERQLGLQFMPEPPDVDEALGVSGQQNELLKRSARSVVKAIATTPEWIAFSEGTKSLDETSSAELRAARSRLKERLRPQMVDDFEPNLAMRRNQYRESMLKESMDELSGKARQFADAFESIDRLIERAASDAFSQLAAYKEFPKFDKPRDIELLLGEPPQVAFTVDDATWPYPGAVFWMTDEFVRDAVQIESVSWNYDLAVGSEHRVGGVVLQGTYEARNSI